MDHVAIIGGGFSGALLAINLLRYDGPRATLIERGAQAGRGTAYSTVHPEHLLNVRAANMSALPDDPGHFTRWLAACSDYDGSGFVPRLLYGDYLEALLRETATRAGDRLAIVRGTAADVGTTDEGAAVTLADGRRIAADRVVLATGNLPPLAPRGIDPDALPPGCFVADPWRGDVGAGLRDDDTVFVIGTGLTMVDVALLLDARGFAGRIVAVSRHGLLPHAHDAVSPTQRPERPPTAPPALLADLRGRARVVPWRAAVDELRPYTQGLWRAMSVPERSRFLRHLRPWWDVHRHRIAPAVAARLAAMRRDGRLIVAAGSIGSVTPDGPGVRIEYRPRGTDARETVMAARIVNATGPQGDLARSDEPLLVALRERGLLRPDPLGIGLDVDQDSQAIGRDGAASDRLMVLGPMTRGAFWEIVAVPDIRRQAWSVARRLANAHWIEGEGL